MSLRNKAPQNRRNFVQVLSANARERAIRYADRQYGNFEEVSLSPYP
jgi:hypothetical protein